MLLRLAPALFVLIWSTGWISAQAAAPYAEPLSFLAIRFALAALALAAILAATGRPIPRRPALWAHGLASGALLHAIYLGGVWWAISEGLPTPYSGLIAALQPLMTAGLAVSLIGERLSARQWAGLGLGLAGLLIALSPRLAAVAPGAEAALGLLIGVNAVAMVGVTLGTLYQKRWLQGVDLPSVALTQYVGAALVTAPVAAALESFRIDWTPVAVATMAWSVIALSLGAIGLLLLLIRHGEVSRAASLVYLIPPVVAVEAYLLFGETLAPVAIGGMTLTVLGVYLVNARPSPRPSPRSGTPRA